MLGSLSVSVTRYNSSLVYVLSERGIDTTLSGDSVRTGGKELGDTSSVEASLGKTEGRTQTSSSSTDDNGIVLVVNDGVLARDEPRSLLSPDVLGTKDAGGGPCRRESSRWCADALRELWRCWLAIAQRTCTRESRCIDASLDRPMENLDDMLDHVHAHCGTCGKRLGVYATGDAGAGGRRATREDSDKTHLAGKLRATHPGEAHDGGSRGVESGVVW